MEIRNVYVTPSPMTCIKNTFGILVYSKEYTFTILCENCDEPWDSIKAGTFLLKTDSTPFNKLVSYLVS
jgi:hypothetical protein